MCVYYVLTTFRFCALLYKIHSSLYKNNNHANAGANNI